METDLDLSMRKNEKIITNIENQEKWPKKPMKKKKIIELESEADLDFHIRKNEETSENIENQDQ